MNPMNPILVSISKGIYAIFEDVIAKYAKVKYSNE